MSVDELKVRRSVRALIAAHGPDATVVAKSRLKEAIELDDPHAIGHWSAVLPAIAQALKDEGLVLD